MGHGQWCVKTYDRVTRVFQDSIWMGLKVPQGVELQESEGDLRIEICVIQDGERMSDKGP